MIKSKKLSKFKNIEHAFFNRLGGNSTGIFKSLNCGMGSSDNKKNILKNLETVSNKIKAKSKKIVLLNQVHSNKFCYMDKNSTSFGSDGFPGPINLGNPNEFSIRQLAKKIIEITGSKSNIIYHPLPSDDPTQRQPDITLARNTLSWEPKVQLDEGLLKTIQYFDALLQNMKK